MKWRYTTWALAFALALCVTGVRAQDQQQNSQSASPTPIPPPNSGGGGGYSKPPAPAARGVSSAYDAPPYDPAQVVPDTNTLSGAQLLGVGSLEHAHNIFDPSISLSELGLITTGTGGQSNLGSETIVNGILNFNRNWSRYHLTTLYTGGGVFYEGPVYSYSQNTQYHDLAVSQKIDWERWHLVLRDDFTVSSGAAFTGTGMGGPGLFAGSSSLLGSSLNSIGQTFIPSQSIQTGNAMRYMNAVLGQAEYSLSRRSTFTFSGSYGLLHFIDAGYISSQMLNAQAGYDYQLDPKNSIAILAGYGKIDYTGTTNFITQYNAGLAYGRKITGRLALQVGGGPMLIRSASGTGSFQFWLASVNTALTYVWRRSGVSLSYARGLNAGSGVFMGATSNTFSGTANHQFTRFWAGSVNGGYALNNSLAPAGAATTSFTNLFGGASLGRQVGRRARISFSYGIWRQTSSSNACPVASCGGTGNQHSFGITVNWHLRPTG
jgi:hypothetical protein